MERVGEELGKKARAEEGGWWTTTITGPMVYYCCTGLHV